MDHSWGRNITIAGLGDLGASLAGYFPPPFLPRFYATNARRGIQFLLARIPLNTEPYEFFWITPTVFQKKTFPFDLAVEPDVPL